MVIGDSRRGRALNPLDGVEIEWEFKREAGEAGASNTRPAVLLVHGSALSRAIWRGFGYQQALLPHYDVLTLDLRGHGRSGKPHQTADYALETVLGDVRAVLDAAEVEAVHYVGYSFGARLGFALAATTPERMLSFTALAGTYRISRGSIAQLFFPDYEAALDSGGMDAFIRGWEDQIGHAVDPVTAMAFKANDPLALRAYFRQTEEAEGIDESVLKHLNVPTLLIAGSRDTRREVDSRRAAELMPRAEFVELPGRDHGDTLFPPGPVLETMFRFLKEVDTSGK